MGNLGHDPPAGEVAEDGVEILKSGKKSLEVPGFARVDDVQVVRVDGGAVEHSAHPADDNEIDPVGYESTEGHRDFRFAIAHAASTSKCRACDLLTYSTARPVSWP